MKDYAKIYKDEIESFRETGHKFLNGELTVPEFKGKSGGFGVYAQRGGKKFMIRLRTPSGIVSLPHYKLTMGYVKKYGLDKVHLTTRQTFQLHDLEFDDVCDIMADAIDHDLFTRGGGGNYPRNVALSVLSGVEQGEAFDVTPFALMVSEYFVSRASTYHLPRKLKVAFSNSEHDTGCATINDVGFMAVIENGEPFFKLFLAGGMGSNPEISIPYGKLVKPEEVMYYVEAMVRLFMEKGNYENKHRARMRYIPKEIGTEEFIQCLEKHLKEVKETEKFDEIHAVVEKEEAWEDSAKKHPLLIPQKQKGLYSVKIHPVCGQMSASLFDKIGMFLEEHKECKKEDGSEKEKGLEVRLSLYEDMYIRNLTASEAEELLSLAKGEAQETKVDMTVTCVGVPTCQMGILQSQSLCRSIKEAVEKANLKWNLLPTIHISGCPNSCSRHQVAELGFAGKKKRVEDSVAEVYDVYVGGALGLGKTKMGELIGSMKVSEIPAFLVQLAGKLEEKEVYFDKFFCESRGEFDQIIASYLV